VEDGAVARAWFRPRNPRERFPPETPQIEGHPPVRHGHNLLLNIAVQLGVVGVGLFVAVLALLAREYARFLAEPAIAPLGVIGLALLAGFLAKNFTDDFLHRHNAQVFWALNGMLLGLARRARR
jgi:O-antigen ligase